MSLPCEIITLKFKFRCNVGNTGAFLIVTHNMLTREDLRFHFYELSLYSKLNIIPLRLNPKSGTFSIAKSPWRQILSRLQLCFFVAQVANANYTLLQSLLYPEHFVIRHFIFHLSLASTSSIAFIWYFVYWIQWPNETALLFNYSFPSCNESVKVCRFSVKSLAASAVAVTLETMAKMVTWKPAESGFSTDGSRTAGNNEKTKLMWLTQMLPEVALCGFCFVIAIFLHEPSLRILRFYGTTDTSWSGSFINFFTSFYFTLYMLSSLAPILEMQLLFFGKLMEKLHHMLKP